MRLMVGDRLTLWVVSMDESLFREGDCHLVGWVKPTEFTRLSSVGFTHPTSVGPLWDRL